MIELKLQDPELTVGEEFAAARILFQKRRALNEQKAHRYREKNAIAGLCTQCPTPATTRLCERCASKEVARVARWRAKGLRKSRSKSMAGTDRI